MKIHTALRQLLFLSLICTPLSGREIDLDKPSSKLRRFANDVIFEVEAGDREKYSKRLSETLTVEFFGQPAEVALTEKHLTDFLLATGVKKIDKAVDGQRSAKISIYFGTQAELSKTAEKLSDKINLSRGYSYWTWWDKDRTINKAVIMLATDKISGEALEDRLIEMLLGVFGFAARSNEIDESCLTSKDAVFTTLQPVDKALLKFYYREVPAGTKPRDFDKLFRDKWKK